MARNRISRKPDERQINIDDDHAIEYWAQQLGVSTKRIIDTVKKVGASVSVVKKNLTNRIIRHGHSGR